MLISEGKLDLDHDLATKLFDVACARSGRTTTEIASRLGKGRAAVAAWRSGERAVALEDANAVCRMAGVWPWELMAMVAVENPRLVAALPAELDIDSTVTRLAVLKSLVESMQREVRDGWRGLGRGAVKVLAVAVPAAGVALSLLLWGRGLPI